MDSRSDDKPMAEMLRQALGDLQDDCPEPEILAAYCEGTLDPPETARYELHFSQCARCREQLALIERTLPASAAQGSPKSGWSWHIFDWRLLAPAAAAILIVAIWMARKPALHEVQNPLVAMSQTSDKLTAPKATSSTLDQDAARVNSDVRAAQSRQNLDIQDRVKPGLIAPQPPRDEKKQFTINRPLATANGSGAMPDNGRGAGLGMSASAPQAMPARAPGAAAAEANAAAQAEAQGPAGVTGGASTVENETQQANSGDVHAKVDALSREERALALQTQSQPPIQTRAPAQVQTLSPAAGLPRQAAEQQVLVQAQVSNLEELDKLDANVIASPKRKTLWRINGGLIERSKDHGASWKTQSTVANGLFTAGAAPDAHTCWLVGRNGLVALTTDSANWRKIPSPVLADLAAITARNADVATVTTADGRKFSTTDAGQHWTAVLQQP